MSSWTERSSQGTDMQKAQRRRGRGRPPKTEASPSDSIVQAALQIFASHGYDGANLRQIAVAANIDVALISHRFGSKLELWKAVVDSLSERFLQSMLPVLRREDQARLPDGEVLQRAIDQMIDLVCDTPQYAMFVVKEVAQQDERFEYVFDRLINPAREVLLPLIRAASASGEIKDVDPDFYFFAFTGSIAMTVVMRPFVAQFSDASKGEASFRKELKRALSTRGVQN